MPEWVQRCSLSSFHFCDGSLFIYWPNYPLAHTLTLNSSRTQVTDKLLWDSIQRNSLHSTITLCSKGHHPPSPPQNPSWNHNLESAYSAFLDAAAAKLQDVATYRETINYLKVWMNRCLARPHTGGLSKTLEAMLVNALHSSFLPGWRRNEWHSSPSMEFSPRCPYLKGVQDQLRKYFLQQGEGPCNSSVVCLCWSFSLGSHICRRFWALLMHPRPPLEAYFLIHCMEVTLCCVC